MKPKNIAVVYMQDSSQEHNATLDYVKKILQKHNPLLVERNRISEKNFSGKDLIIIVGGDGTFLRTSHFVDGKQVLLGVNSDTANKEGFFMCCARKNFQKKFNEFMNGKAGIMKLARLEAKMNGTKLPLCLNEIYIGDAKPYKMSYYDLKIGNYRECHRSSGILIATPAGSHAWIKSAGGRKLPLNAQKFQIFAREPYIRRLNRQKIKSRIMARNDAVEIYSLMKNGIIAVDSISHEHRFNYGQKIKVKLSKKFLNVVR